MYVSLLITNSLIPTIMIIFGLLWKNNPPRSINWVYGYRTPMSMKNLETWKFAHSHNAKIWRWSGLIWFVISAGLMIIFSIWGIAGLVPIALGIHTWRSSKAINFWANIKITEGMSDVKSYNQAVAKLLWIFGIIFILLGLPLLLGQNSPLIILSVLGTIFECIFFMIMLIKIANKYK